jgi:hypothetical protein
METILVGLAAVLSVGLVAYLFRLKAQTQEPPWMRN